MKAENFQRMGAFKFRGGYNAINSLTDAERGRGVLAFSSGNHAQAVALAARFHGCTATILMPADAPNAKLDATHRIHHRAAHPLQRRTRRTGHHVLPRPLRQRHRVQGV